MYGETIKNFIKKGKEMVDEFAKESKLQENKGNESHSKRNGIISFPWSS